MVGGREPYIFPSTKPRLHLIPINFPLFFLNLRLDLPVISNKSNPITMGKKRVLVGYGVDIDAVAGWLGSYGGEDSVSDISRGKLMCH